MIMYYFLDKAALTSDWNNYTLEYLTFRTQNYDIYSTDTFSYEELI